MELSCRYLKDGMRIGDIGPKWLLELAQSESVEFRYHPLGFISGQLWQSDLEFVRLHIWCKESSVEQCPYFGIHDHVFDLESLVMCGRVMNRLYEELDGPATHRVYNVRYEGEESVTRASEHSTRIRMVEETVCGTGDSYKVPKGRLHESVLVGTSPAMTVVFARRVSSSMPSVLGSLDGRGEYRYHRQKVDAELLSEIVRMLSEL